MLQAPPRPVTVRAVPAHGANRARALRARQSRAAARRARRIAALVVAAAALLITLLLTAFGSNSSPAALAPAAPAPATRLLPAGPPRPQVIAVRGSLRIQMPVAQSRVTAIGYHASSGGSLALSPVGRQANAGLLARLARRLLGTRGSGLAYYLLGGSGPATSVLNVGAPPGTDVYAPVDGTVLGISDYIISGRKRGARIDIQPSGAASIVVSLTHLRPDPALTVGSTVTAASSKVGTLLDFSDAERQALARYTNDAGNHVAVEVHPAATLSP
jgi:hypothetical protein